MGFGCLVFGAVFPMAAITTGFLVAAFSVALIVHPPFLERVAQRLTQSRRPQVGRWARLTLVVGVSLAFFGVVRHASEQAAQEKTAAVAAKRQGRISASVQAARSAAGAGDWKMAFDRLAEAEKIDASAKQVVVAKNELDRRYHELLEAGAAEANTKLLLLLKSAAEQEAAESFEGADATLGEAAEILAPYVERVRPLPAVIADSAKRAVEKRSHISAILAARRLAVEAAQRTASGEKSARAGAALEAEQSYEKAARALQQVPVDYGKFTDVETQQQRLKKLRKKVARAAAAERKQVETRAKAAEARRAKEQLRREVCGDKPQQSSWDGAVPAAEMYFKRAANDPESVDFEGCTEPRMTEDDCWVTVCRVRAKNGFGALIVQTWRFSIIHWPEIPAMGQVASAREVR